MGMIDSLRKGFGFMLMCFGVSRPAPKSKPATAPARKIKDGK
jgi:hypothetical protein